MSELLRDITGFYKGAWYDHLMPLLLTQLSLFHGTSLFSGDVLDKQVLFLA